MSEEEKTNRGQVLAPLWVAVVTYLVCWPVGVWMIIEEVSAERSDHIIVVLGITLVLAPVSGFKPTELLKVVFGK